MQTCKKRAKKTKTAPWGRCFVGVQTFICWLYVCCWWYHLWWYYYFAFLSSIFFRYGYFSGINRKVQFKYLGKPRDGSESESSESRLTDSGSDEKSGKQKVGKEAKTKDTKEGTGQSSEESQENEETKDEKLKVPVDSEHALLLIVKWGGELTTMGKEQALQLGRAFRYIYMK